MHTDLEAVRLRADMYVGDTRNGDGLHELLWRVVGHVVDQHLARSATELCVDVTPDAWITVRDDGPGFAVERRPGEAPALDDLFLHVLGGRRARRSPPPHRSALAVVNALSARLEVETTRDGVRWGQAFERGVAVGELRRLGSTSVEGTSIRFQPDARIFGALDVDHAHVAQRLQRIAWLNPLLRVVMLGRRIGRGGLRRWVEHIAAQHGPLHALCAAHQPAERAFVDVALGWTASPGTAMWSFVNTHETTSGTHISGLWRGIAACARQLGAEARGAAQVCERLAPGLVAVLHVVMPEPGCSGSMLQHLESPEAMTAVQSTIERELPAAMARDPRLRSFLRQRLGAAGPG